MRDRYCCSVVLLLRRPGSLSGPRPTIGCSRKNRRNGSVSMTSALASGQYGYGRSGPNGHFGCLDRRRTPSRVMFFAMPRRTRRSAPVAKVTTGGTPSRVLGSGCFNCHPGW